MTDAASLHLGDCLDVLRTMADCSVDAVVTDPPYGLAFMGKRWDYDVPSVEIWAECLRVLKPGGHLLAFAGTRTQHRMAMRIEDAGFEIRDMIAWVYGSGFPKSLDVSKAIDRMDASEEQEQRRLRFTAWVRSQGVTSKQIDKATGTNMGGRYTTAASQPAIMTREHLEACRYLFREVPEWVEQECDIRSVESRNMAEREVVGHRTGTDTKKQRMAVTLQAQDLCVSTRHTFAITAPATEAAQQWAGWGTALKPALEPITVARKPLAGTVAENVLAHGTGALNIDGCRIGTSKNVPASVSKKAPANCYGRYAESGETPGVGGHDPNLGRWPANLIHDGSDEVVGLFPQSEGMKRGTLRRGATTGLAMGAHGIYGEMQPMEVQAGYGDSGSAARFFYCAKASKADRGPENSHPTVKPTELMRYLCRLVTPPGGVVLDPFMGSGSTGKAAMLEGFRFIGIERDADSFATAQRRIDRAGAAGYQPTLLFPCS